MVFSNSSDCSEKFNAYEEVLDGSSLPPPPPMLMSTGPGYPFDILASHENSHLPPHSAHPPPPPPPPPPPLPPLLIAEKRKNSSTNRGDSKNSIHDLTQKVHRSLSVKVDSYPSLSSNVYVSSGQDPPSLPILSTSNGTAPMELSSLKVLKDLSMCNQHFRGQVSGTFNSSLVKTDPIMRDNLGKPFDQLQKDNIQLLAILQTNNEVMKKNLKIAQGLKEELILSQKSFQDLKESSDGIINRLKVENEELKGKLNEMKPGSNSSTQVTITGSEKDGETDCDGSMEKDTKIYQLSMALLDKEAKINQLTGEVSELSSRCEKLEEDNRMLEELRSKCQKYEYEERFQSGLMAEMKDLKEILNQLQQEKITLQEKLDRDQHHNNHRSDSKASKKKSKKEEKKNPKIESQNNKKESETNGKNHEDEPTDEIKNQGFSRYRPFNKLEKRMKSALPALNSGILFHGFRTYSSSSSPPK